MKAKAWIGADPGASGALALYVPDRRPAQVVVEDMPKFADGTLDHWRLARNLRLWAEDYEILGVTVERVSAMPGQGVTSMFSFGHAFGALKQAIVSAGMHFTLVAPGTWKAIYGLRGGRENKAASAEKAVELFPDLKPQLYGPRGGVKDGRAEAVLLAHYGSRLRGSP